MATTITRTNDTDDDGTGTTGTIRNNSWKTTTIYDPIDALFNGASVFELGGALALGRYTTTATGTKNDWAIDTDNGGTTVGVLRCNNVSSLTINGIVAPSAHRALWIMAINSTVNLAHENASSTAANRITTPTAATVAIPSGGYALLVYDVTTARWRVLSPHATRIDDLSAAADNTNLNVSTSAHGLVPKISGSDGYTLQKSGSSAVWAAASGGGTFTEQTTTATGTQNNFDLNAHLTYLRCTGAAPSFSGFTVLGSAPSAGDRVYIECLGTTAKVTHQDTNSTAANRVLCPSTFGQIIGVNGVMLLIYDATTSRWREHVLDPGAAIDHTFAAGDYTANNSMTWTVASGDVAIDKYIQRGATLQLFFTANTTTVGGTPSSELRKAIPGGFTAASGLHQCPDMTFYDNNVWSSVRISIATSQSNAYIRFNRNDSANFAAATDTTYVYISSWTFPIN